MRDLLLQLSVTDIFRGKWTKDIHQEWITALMRNEPERDRFALIRTRDLMNQSTRDCLIENYEPIIPSLVLPDQNDRHVLAAAIVGRCDVIVTQNLKDFPEEALSPYGIEAQHPDEFLLNQLDLEPSVFFDAIKTVRARLKNPPYSPKEYLAILTNQGLVATASELERFSNLI